VEVQQSVVQYFNSLQCITNFLPTNKDWCIDITQHFWTHLLNNIRVQMQANGYVHNSAKSKRDPFSQLMSLQRAFAAATVAKDTLTHFQSITRDNVQSSLTLATNIGNLWVGNSVAEDTMSKYDKDNSNEKPIGPCWDCGSIPITPSPTTRLLPFLTRTNQALWRKLLKLAKISATNCLQGRKYGVRETATMDELMDYCPSLATLKSNPSPIRRATAIVTL
jgi:hypothetical protein